MNGKKLPVIYRVDNSMGTYYGPQGELYDRAKFEGYVKAITTTLGDLHWCGVAEPFPDGKARLSDYHMHINHVWPLGVKKQISVAMQKKIQTILKGVDPQTHDYSKAAKKGIDRIQKAVNDGKYAKGESVKDKAYKGPQDKKGKSMRRKEDGTKTHHHVIMSPGYANWLNQKIALLAKLRKEKADLGGFDPTIMSDLCHALMQNTGLKPCQIYKKALAEGNIKLQKYVVKNLKQLEDDWSNLLQIRAQIELMDEIMPAMNPFQTSCTEIIEASTTDRHHGQFNWYVDPHGGAGKSTLQTMRYNSTGAAEFPCCKSADIAKAFNYEKEVNFNFTADTDMSEVPYTAIENLCDGKIFNTKYHSKMKRVPKPQINVFSNSIPMFYRDGKPTMIPDRWNVYIWNHKKEQFTKMPLLVMFPHLEPPKSPFTLAMPVQTIEMERLSVRPAKRPRPAPATYDQIKHNYMPHGFRDCPESMFRNLSI